MSGDCAEHITRSGAFTDGQTYCWRFHYKQPHQQDNDRTSQRDRKKKKKKSPVLCATAIQMSLFEHVSKHSLRFYHMTLVWTPPCSALLYSFYTFQSDRLARLLSFYICLVLSLLFYVLPFALSSLHPPPFFHDCFLLLLLYSFDITLTPLCHVIFAACVLLLK